MSLLRKGCECSLFLLLPPLCQPSALPSLPSNEHSERLYPNKDRRPGDACMGGGVGGGWVVWMVGLEQRGERGVYGGWGGLGGDFGGGRGVQFRRPLWSLENSGIVPAGMQHQQWTRSHFVTLRAQTRGRALSVEQFFNTSPSGVTGFKSGQWPRHHDKCWTDSLMDSNATASFILVESSN